ncbi:hypothetical protein [Clostridium algidicarnis]|uniref:hypothetical protein n=1 Tax=Clostridium algidicarnis TaxID=37659 RepID=UPI001C0CEDEF|nr:hypothetical protein [Clostridium algidicarnis]MBU3208196.1 hypothetical protein [Clostridium algidicarnis]MBU3227572.1 hypothetical protein [Clostridium algidicarnis]MBU3251021.1 hypothetical protein [Clostridium algidicarnis]
MPGYGIGLNLSKSIIDYCITNGLSVSGFKPGDNPKIIDLLYGIPLESGGEASITLARIVVAAHADGNIETEQYNLIDTQKIYRKLKKLDLKRYNYNCCLRYFKITQIIDGGVIVIFIIKID